MLHARSKHGTSLHSDWFSKDFGRLRRPREGEGEDSLAWHMHGASVGRGLCMYGVWKKLQKKRRKKHVKEKSECQFNCCCPWFSYPACFVYCITFYSLLEGYLKMVFNGQPFSLYPSNKPQNETPPPACSPPPEEMVGNGGKWWRMVGYVWECWRIMGMAAITGFQNSDLKMAILVLKTAPNHQNSD